MKKSGTLVTKLMVLMNHGLGTTSALKDIVTMVSYGDAL